MAVIIPVVWATYWKLAPDQRDAWWLQLIHEAAEAERTYSGRDDDPVRIACRLMDRIDELEPQAKPGED